MNPIDDKHLMKVTPRPDLVMVKGHGSYLWDNNGKQYLDFVQGWAVNALGHSSPELKSAVAKQAELLVTPSPAFHNEPQLRLATRIAELTGLDQAHFSSTGAEANEVAVKLARKWGKLNRHGAYEVITTHDAFHGRTLAMMAASGKPGWDSLFPPMLDGFRKVPFGDVSSVARAINSQTVAIMVEPIQGEAGVVVPPPGYLKALRQLADESGILLIIDEIQTGIARTGTLFAYQADRVLPDILTLGKGLGAGFPISATVAQSRACCFDYGDQGGTFNGNPLAASVANSVLDVVCQAEFLANVTRVGQRLEQGLTEISPRMNFKQVRGKGLLWAVVLESDIAFAVRDACFQQGLIVNAARPSILRLMPSLRVTISEVEEAIDLLEVCLSSVLAAA